MTGQLRCVLAVCVLGALLLADPAAAEKRTVDQIQTPAVLHGATLNHRRALRLIVESTTGWWFGDTLAQTQVTLVPASSLKKKPAATTTVVVEEEQLSTAHLKDVELPESYKHKFGAKGDSTTLYPVTVTVVEESDAKAEAGR
ncbi:hypothetical protein COO60DRAFT_1672889 [Scenedesmus sp. NREL 46B-D3]|nr:hypothetical protein COO60DRAFT_1672889 [Scenedesmus sp. NREL 46B-D3]